MVKTMESPVNITNTESDDLFDVLGLEIDSTDSLGLSLSAYILNLWEDAKRAKQPWESLMLAMKRQKEGEYDADKLAAIKSIEGAEDFIKLTGAKCRAAKAWIKEIILSPTQRIWGIEPTPVPELPQYIKQTLEEELFNQAVNQFIALAQQTGQPIPSELILQQIQQMMPEFEKFAHNELAKKARDLADQMADKIDDQLTEGGFYEALNGCIDDIVDYKAGFIKGPTFRKERVKKIDRNPLTGQLFQRIEETIIPQYDRVSPFNIYPSSYSTTIKDGYFFEVLRLKPQDLYGLIGVKGYNESEIRAVLEDFNGNSISKWLNIPSEVEEATGDDDLDSPSRSEKIPVLEYWGPIPGSLLLSWGMTSKQIKDPDNWYDVCLWFVNHHILKCMLNPDGLGEKPYSKTSYIAVQDSFWGEGLPDTIKDVQKICNATVRAIVYNIGMASGPQVEQNIDRMPPGESRKMWPWKVWGVTDEQMSTAPALKFYQPQMVGQQLILIYQFFSRLADEHSGVPAYAHGDTQVGGAGSTASGLSMLTAMAARGIRAVIGSIDRDIVIPILQRQYEYNINQREMFSMIGDYKIVARGSSALMRKEQQAVRKTEMLAAVNNPVDMQILGAEGRKAQLVDAFQSLDIPTDRIIPEKLPINPLPLLQQLGINPQALLGPGAEESGDQGTQTGTMTATPSSGPSALNAAPPLPRPQNLDEAGNNVQGTQTRMFNG